MRLIEFVRIAARDRKQRGEGKPGTFTFLGFTHFCGQFTIGALIVWRITAKKRLVAKLKAIKAELRRRRHHRTTEVGAWSLNPGRYVGVTPGEKVGDDDFREQLETLNEELETLNAHPRSF
jgi:hypothetical protein